MITKQLVLTKNELISTIKYFVWAAYTDRNHDSAPQYMQYADTLIDLLGKNVPDDLTFGLNFKTCKNLQEAVNDMKESRKEGRMSVLLDTDDKVNKTQH